MKNKGMQIAFKNIRIKKLEEPLEFYLRTQFSFAGLLIADKTNAAHFDSLIEDNTVSIGEFGNIYSDILNDYLSKLSSNTELNLLRTKIRKEAVVNIEIGLKDGNHVFELTAPTGSGKTLILLSAASQIIKQKKESFRILYILPFLSITEQVEKEINEIFKKNKNFIRRIDSKAIDSEKFDILQRKLDIGIDEDVMKEMDLLEFQSKTFSYPLVITTFVRFFETILSNRNSELLKLTNFSHAIFLIDEIQSLPPRLYGFFVAYIDKFCKMFNSYAVVSTATQPNYAFPSDKDKSKYEVFFKRDKEPFPILSLNYFSNQLFNRYSVNIDDKESISIEELYEKIVSKECSVLIILNTIDDTKDLYKIFIEKGYSYSEVFLLNTHITPKDRNKKIEKVKEKLAEGKIVILISTQLIEAGVDIDFPIVFRDFAIISSIVQSAGRCNRNGKLKERGKVYVFKLKNRNKIRCNLIYSGEKDRDLLRFTKDILVEKNHYEENELLHLQQRFFGKIQEELLWGIYFINTEKNITEANLIDNIQKVQFEEIGKFQLIDDDVFDKEYQFYIPDDENDTYFEDLIEYRNELFELLKQKESLDIIKNQKRKIKNHLMKMSSQIIQVRIKSKDNIPAKTELDDYYNLRKISNGYYTFEEGINLRGGDSII
jgi:CRISPR-associated endonuclease/helicase Cas3